VHFANAFSPPSIVHDKYKIRKLLIKWLLKNGQVTASSPAKSHGNPMLGLVEET